ncbi:thiamine phosphate synthase [Dehalococcoidia bacterium]|nr:thiamine phosphate synthase [Dehalococcoidia bacterium]
MKIARSRHTNLPRPCLCFVTERNQTEARPLEEIVVAAVAGGVGMVQLRDRDLPAGMLLQLAHTLRLITEGRALLIVNDRIDVALLCGADGVQLGEESVGIEEARGISGKDMLLGRSVHTVDGAVQATSDGADFLLVGTIFETDSHAEMVAAGPDLLSSVRTKTDIPILGIGGVDQNNIAQVIEAGADGAAVISAISRTVDPRSAAYAISEQMNWAWDQSMVAAG